MTQIKKKNYILKTNFFILVFTLLFTFFPSQAQDARKFTTHIVKEGESIKDIAKKYDTKTRVIKDLNPDINKNSDLKVNMTLVVPNNKASEPEVTNRPNKDPLRKTHIVKKGETVFSIAKEYGVTMQSLREINGLENNDLALGQVLTIPDTSDFTVKPVNKNLFLYEVKKGDTKFSLSKRFDVSIENIEQLNPQLKTEDLKEGSSIWLPKEKVTEIVEIEEINSSENSDQPFIYHQYKEGEELFRIAVIYGTTEEAIRAMNPEAFKKLRPGMLLKIPGKKKDEFLMHEVTKGETIFRITHDYNITEEELFELNPALREGTLPEGVEIFIKPLDAMSGKQKFEYPDFMMGQVNVSFMMPMYADQNIDLSVTNKQSQLRKIITDFYMGAEMAIKDLESKGLNVTYHVYDTKNSISTINQLMDDSFIKNSDIIIGPFFFNNAEYLAKEFKDKIVVSPMYSKDQSSNNSKNLIKTGVRPQELSDKLAEYIVENHTNEKVILITDYASSSKASVIEQRLNAKNIPFTKILPNSNKSGQIYVSKDRMNNSVVSNLPNWIILVSENNIVVSDVVSTYGVLATRKDITLFTIDEFKDFNHINISYLPHLKWSFPTTQLTGLDSSKSNDFSSIYKNLYNDQPTDYAYSGYDITYDILARYSTGDIYSNLKDMYTEGLSRVFDYEKSFRDYENKGVYLVEMNANYGFEIKH